MNIIAVIGAFFQLLLMWFKVKMEKDALRKQKKDEILTEAKHALEARDPSAINAAINKLNRL